MRARSARCSASPAAAAVRCATSCAASSPTFSTGSPLVAALDAFAARTSVTALARFLDGLVVAVERGTPLADLLRAQAGDVRESAKRQLMESGGRKEIAMMIPVVFLVLPTVVVFAAYPAFTSLTFVTH